MMKQILKHRKNVCFSGMHEKNITNINQEYVCSLLYGLLKFRKECFASEKKNVL